MDIDNLTNQDRMELLAAMCLCVHPFFVRGDLIKLYGTDYISQNGDDIAIAQKLFRDSGIDMKIRKRRISPNITQSILVKSSLFGNNKKFRKAVSFVKDLDKTIQVVSSSEKWWDLQKALGEIRQEQNQK